VPKTGSTAPYYVPYPFGGPMLSAGERHLCLAVEVSRDEPCGVLVVENRLTRSSFGDATFPQARKGGDLVS
jgi:hypothetical protein